MKSKLIPILMVAIIGILLYIAVQQPEAQTKPTPITQTPQAPTPKAPEIPRGEPTPKAPELPQATEPGVPAQLAFPETVNFWVNEIKVPETTAYVEGFNYIPLRKSDLKTFAGNFGQYPTDPTQNLKVVLCAEFYKVQAAPACETVPIIYKDGYVTFAKGYQFDEYIGAMAAKDYIAYYDVYAGQTKVASSNKAVIRTVSD